MKRWMTAAVTAALMAAEAFGQTTSLFKDGRAARPGEATVRTASLARVTTSADRDFKKHDLITIIIEEQTKTKTVADSETDKKMSVRATVNSWPKFVTGGVVRDVSPVQPEVLGVKAERGFEGGGAKRRDDLFVERITAEIVDIKPNDTIVLEARKERKWMGELQILHLTGVVRRQDIAADNTVRSHHVADMRLSYETRGQVSDSARRGIVDWILDLVNIF